MNAVAIRSIVVLTACLGLGACASSPSARFYSLAAAPAEPVTTAPEDFGLAVGPIRVAAYLDRPQIVSRASSTELSLAEYDRWAEPLVPAINRVVAENLSALLGTGRVADQTAWSKIDAEYRLIAQVTRFDLEAGQAVLEVQWAIRDPQRKALETARRSRYTQPVSGPADGYAAAVTALNATLEAFCRDVALEIDRRLSEGPRD